MIRLSEALARVHCSKTITPDYVKEAARLLSNSILRVERPDLEIEPYDDTADINANTKPSDTNILVNNIFLDLFLIIIHKNRKKSCAK